VSYVMTQLKVHTYYAMYINGFRKFISLSTTGISLMGVNRTQQVSFVELKV